jgi:hypothetical protein
MADEDLEYLYKWSDKKNPECICPNYKKYSSEIIGQVLGRKFSQFSAQQPSRSYVFLSPMFILDKNCWIGTIGPECLLNRHKAIMVGIFKYDIDYLYINFPTDELAYTFRKSFAVSESMACSIVSHDCLVVRKDSFKAMFLTRSFTPLVRTCQGNKYIITENSCIKYTFYCRSPQVAKELYDNDKFMNIDKYNKTTDIEERAKLLIEKCKSITGQ